MVHDDDTSTPGHESIESSEMASRPPSAALTPEVYDLIKDYAAEDESRLPGQVLEWIQKEKGYSAITRADVQHVLTSERRLRQPGDAVPPTTP